MTKYFHLNLNLMALFTALIAGALIIFWHPFMAAVSANFLLNGIIIGTTIFGVGLCFVHMFYLLPEYRWVRQYFGGRARRGRVTQMPPRILRPVAVVLRNHPNRITPITLNGLLEMILLRFEDSRESIRYIGNTLVFLGLLGTFWGLIMTVGGFAELIGVLDFNDVTVMERMQDGLSAPLAGMATAFTSSLLGLGGSLVVGFLALQVQLAQNTIYAEVEEKLSAYTYIADENANMREMGKLRGEIEKLNSILD